MVEQVTQIELALSAWESDRFIVSRAAEQAFRAAAGSRDLPLTTPANCLLTARRSLPAFSHPC